MSGSFDTLQKLVLDNGSNSIKIGFSGEPIPRSEIPNVYSDSSDETPLGTMGEVDCANPLYPTMFGEIVDWEGCERLWQKAIFSVATTHNLQNFPMLYAMPPLEATMAEKQGHLTQVAEVMFEFYNVHSLAAFNSASLSLFSTGHTSGVSVQLGHSITTCAPVFEGLLVPGAKSRQFGGLDITGNLRTFIVQQCDATQDFVWESLTNMPQSYYTRLKEELYNNDDFQLPDGTKVQLPESLIAESKRFVDESTWDAIVQSTTEKYDAVSSTIVVSGGTSLMPGILSKIEPVTVAKRPGTAAWMGGSVVACLPFDKAFLPSQEYEEQGATRLFRTCATL
eukprot:Platyproteum_vivax@DN7362_c0_g1_i3.p1